jgi:hypothetical protein
MLLNLLVMGTYSEMHVSVDHQFGSLKSGPLLLEDPKGGCGGAQG